MIVISVNVRGRFLDRNARFRLFRRLLIHFGLRDQRDRREHLHECDECPSYQTGNHRRQHDVPE